MSYLFKGKYWVSVKTQKGNNVLSYKVDTLPHETISDAMKILSTANIEKIIISDMNSVEIIIFEA